jgi:hypothetical protein
MGAIDPGMEFEWILNGPRVCDWVGFLFFIENGGREVVPQDFLVVCINGFGKPGFGYNIL